MRRTPVAIVVGLAVTLLWPHGAAASGQELFISTSHSVIKANQALKDGRLEEAVRLYHRALDSDPSSRDLLRSLNGLCVAYYLLEQYDTALVQCDRAIAKKPNVWLGYNNRGNVYFMMGELEQAISDYKRGLKMSPRSTALRDNFRLAEERAAADRLLGPDVESVDAGRIKESDNRD